MMEYIDEKTVSLLKLFSLYPECARGIVGQTESLKDRFSRYNGSPQMFRTSDSGRYLEQVRLVAF